MIQQLDWMNNLNQNVQFIKEKIDNMPKKMTMYREKGNGASCPKTHT
jgi:hypothetical protein